MTRSVRETAAVNGIEAFPVEVEVNSGWGDTVVVLIMSISPISRSVRIEQKYGLTPAIAVRPIL